MDQRITDTVSENGTDSHDVAFETELSEAPWNRVSRGSGETGLREGVREAMAGLRSPGRELACERSRTPQQGGPERDRLRLIQSEGVNHAIKHGLMVIWRMTASRMALPLDPATTSRTRHNTWMQSIGP